MYMHSERPGEQNSRVGYILHQITPLYVVRTIIAGTATGE